MAAFTPVKINIRLINEYGKNGDFELIQKIDFSLFEKEYIQEIIRNIHNYKQEMRVQHSKDLNNEHIVEKLNNISKCLEYIGEQYYKEYTWDTEDFTIYSKCYYDGNRCVHKVLNKTTQEYSAVYCFELSKICNHGHFDYIKKQINNTSL